MMTLISIVVLCLSLITTSHSFSTGTLITTTTTTTTTTTSIYGKRGQDEDEPKDTSNRRNFLVQSRNVILGGGAATATGWVSVLPQSASASVVTTPAFSKDVYWPVGKVAFSLLPLAGTSTRRATVEECIIPNTIWTHDQIQGVVNVNVPVRQTVIKVNNSNNNYHLYTIQLHIYIYFLVYSHLLLLYFFFLMDLRSFIRSFIHS